MGGPTQAMIWEMWRRMRNGLLFCAFIFCFVFGCLVFLGAIAPLEESQGELLEIHVTLLTTILLGIAFGSSLAASATTGEKTGSVFNALEFCRPIGTRRLVGVPMGFLASFAALVCVLQVLLGRLVFGIDLPLLPIVILVFASSCLLHMASWSVRGMVMQALALSLVGAVIGTFGLCWFLWQLPSLDETPFPPTLWLFGHLHLIAPAMEGEALELRLLPVHYGALVLVTLFAFIVAPMAVARQRCGETLCPGDRDIRRLLDSVAARLPLCQHVLGSSWSAQYWMELRRGGVPVLVALACVLVGVFAVSLVVCFFVRFPRELSFGWGCLGGIFVLAALFQGIQSMSGLRRDGPAVWLSVFEATRPVSSGRLVAIKLSALGSILALGLVMTGLSAVVWTTLWVDLETWMREEHLLPLGDLSHHWQASPGMVTAVVLIAVFSGLIFVWTVISWLLTCTLWIEFHRWLCGIVGFVLVALLLIAAWDSKHGGHLSILWQLEGWVLAVGIVGLSLLAFVKASMRGLLNWQSLAAALATWLVFVGGTAVVLRLMAADLDLVEYPAGALALSAALLVLPLTSVAAAPLALDSLRHG